MVVVGDVLGVLRLPLPWLHHVVAVVGSPSRAIDIVRLCVTPGHCSLVDGG